MAFKCKIGLHTWNGLECSDCGKTRDRAKDCLKRGAGHYHDWTKDCEKCSKCGKPKENRHKWYWDKDCEKCYICSKTKEHQHDWSTDCEKCSICHEIRQSAHIAKQ
jgi:hypothetical protein